MSKLYTELEQLFINIIVDNRIKEGAFEKLYFKKPDHPTGQINYFDRICLN